MRDDGRICLAPWTHLHVRVDGNIAPCCKWEGSLGNINHTSLQEVWNSGPSRQLRLALRDGRRVDACRRCHELEAAGASSMRVAMNGQLAHHEWRLEATEADGGLVPTPATLDIRVSNLCNFRCRSCYHGASSRWYSDARALNEACAPVALIEAAGDPQKLLDDLSAFIPGIEEIYFAGGEPLLHDQHLALLDMLMVRNRTDVALKYNTNLSRLDFNDRDICAVWRHFPNVHVRASIDGAGDRGALIRDGFVWSTATDNLARVRRECPHVVLVIDTTVSVLNVLHLPELQNALLATGHVGLDALELHLLQVPEIYNVRVLPLPLKDEVRLSLTAHLDVLRSNTRESRGAALQERQFGSVLSYMFSEDWSHLLNDLAIRTRRLDSLRGQSTEQVLPELSRIL